MNPIMKKVIMIGLGIFLVVIPDPVTTMAGLILILAAFALKL